MVNKEITKISIKIPKTDFELKAMIKRIKQKKLSVSEVGQKALKFYYKNFLSDSTDKKYEKLILEYERKSEMEKFNESRERISKINERLRKLE